MILSNVLTDPILLLVNWLDELRHIMPRYEFLEVISDFEQCSNRPNFTFGQLFLRIG